MVIRLMATIVGASVLSSGCTGDLGGGAAPAPGPGASGSSVSGPGASATAAASGPGGAGGQGGDAVGGTGGSGGDGQFQLVDSLAGTTAGTQYGGSLGPKGWTVTGNADRIIYAVPRLVSGSVEFTVSGVSLAQLPLNDHEIFAMYEGGYGIADPIPYNPEFRVNHYKAMLRIYGTSEPGREGQPKLMWGMCPGGAPGYGESCACASFFEEPWGGEATWDGSPLAWRIEWGAGKTRLLRQGALVHEIDWSASGLAYGPADLRISLGTPRPLDVPSAAMPIGAVFSDVKIEGVVGPEASCSP
jgi:hypothetical protein